LPPVFFGNNTVTVKQRVWLLVFALGMLTEPGFAQSTLSDAQTITTQSVTRASWVSSNSAIALVDGESFVLGVWSAMVPRLPYAKFPRNPAL
jgi:hypothetical protein